MRYDGRFAELDAGVAHLAVKVVDNRGFLVGGRLLPRDQRINDGLDSGGIGAAIHNLCVLGRNPLPGLAGGECDGGKADGIRREIGLARLDAFQRAGVDAKHDAPS